MSKQATYDLFISYADDDTNWVDGLLLPALGLPEKRIITKESFRYGVDAVAEFERAVSESRYTLLILSPAFLADMWGMYSESIASYARVKDERERLLPLLLKSCQIPPRIEALKVFFNCTDRSSQDTHISRLRELFKQPEPSLRPLPCPYPGMRPFTEADSHYFFGRDRDVKELIEHLRSYPFVTVIGPSGSGKSSLVFAGLFPALRRGELFETREWRVCDMRPGENPLTELKKTLGSELTNPEMAVKRALAQQPDAQRLLLVFDQFEEVFALSGQETTSFQETLQHLADVPNCCIILTVRADFYPDVMTSSLWNQIQHHRKDVVPLDKEGLRDAILKPAEQVGVFVETALVERLVADAADEPGVLPLVQETLALLWGGLKRRFLPLTAYEDLSRSENAQLTGLQVAIACHADTVLAELRDEQQTIARRIFLRLIQFGEGRPDTRRQQTVKVLRSADENQKEFDHTLEHLTMHRLLTRSGTEKDEESQVDIAHDALIDGWPTLQNWVKEWRKAEQTRRQLEVKVSDWERLNREGGLLDEVELREAEEWLNSPDAVVLRYSRKLPELIKVSREAIENELEKTRATARRLRKRLIFATVFAIVAVLAAIGTYYGFRQATQNEKIATQQKEIAQQERDRANQERNTAQRQTIEALNQTSKTLFLAHDELGALLASVKAGINLKKINAPTTLKYQTILNLREIVYGIREKNRLIGHKFPVFSVAFSPDGTLLVSGSSTGYIAETKLWSTVGWSNIMTLPDKDSSGTAIFNPDGRLLALSHGNSTKLWNVERRSKSVILEGDPYAGACMGMGPCSSAPPLPSSEISFSPNGRLLASRNGDNTISLWDVEHNKEITILQKSPYSHGARSVAFSPDSRLLASGAIDNTISLWDLEHNMEVASLKGHSDNIQTIVFSPDGRLLASGSADATIKLWNVEHSKEIATLTGHTDIVQSIAFSPNGRLLASGSKDATIKLWNIDDLDEYPRSKEMITLQGHNAAVYSVAFSPDGRLLASGSEDTTIKLWTIINSNDLTILPGFTVALSSDGRRLASVNDDTITLWDVEHDREIISLKGNFLPGNSVAFSPDAGLLASGGEHNIINMWDTENGGKIATLEGHAADVPDDVDSIAFSPDGKLLASGSEDTTITLWGLKDGKKLAILKGHSDFVNSLAFSPDNRLLASGSTDNTIKLWDVEHAREISTLEGHSNDVWSVSFSPDGRLLASGSEDKTIKLWNVEHGMEVTTLRVYSDGVYSVAFSPNGRLLASGNGVYFDGHYRPDSWFINDNTIRLWNVEEHSEIGILKGHSGGVGRIVFSPDGKFVVSACGDRTIILWNLDLDDLLVRGCKWLQGYLKNPNANISDEDRTLCDDILKNDRD